MGVTGLINRMTDKHSSCGFSMPDEFARVHITGHGISQEGKQFYSDNIACSIWVTRVDKVQSSRDKSQETVAIRLESSS